MPNSDIRKLRRAAGLTQAEAAALVHSSVRAWQYWEAGTIQMPQAKRELLLQKLEQNRKGHE